MVRMSVSRDIYSKGVSLKDSSKEMIEEVQVVDNGNFFTKKVGFLTSIIVLTIIFILSVIYGIYLGRKKMRKYR